MPGVITCPGLGDGDAVGICMPGVITCPGLADGDAVGICMPGVITCPGVGDGDGLGLVVLLVGVRLTRGAVLFFFGAAFGFGLAAGFILDMSCPSCCGNALTLSANTKASALTVRSAILKLLGRFMVPPYLVVKANSDDFLDKA
ncbi:MAG: hypothetical protein ACR2HX_16400 [Pyrinomonadaceae bacterium]